MFFDLRISHKQALAVVVITMIAAEGLSALVITVASGLHIAGFVPLTGADLPTYVLLPVWIAGLTLALRVVGGHWSRSR
jgi:hypothetical protein